MKTRSILLSVSFFFLSSCIFTKPSLDKDYIPYQELEFGTIYRSFDVFRSIYFYEHSTLNKALGNKSPISLYIFNTDEDSGLRLTMRYVGSNWLYVKYITVLNSSGEKVTWYFEQSKMKRDVNNGSVFETYDNRFPKNIYDSLKEVLEGGGIQMRLYGDDGYKEYTIPPDETKGLIEIIDFYETSLFER